MSKCNKTAEDEDEYGPNSDGPPLIDSMFVKPGAGAGGPGAGAGSGDCPPPPPPPNGNLSCSNPDLVQVNCHPVILLLCLANSSSILDFLSKLALLILQLYLASHLNTNLPAKVAYLENVKSFIIPSSI